MTNRPAGTLYACGCALGKHQDFLPLAKGVDNQGHCPYPQPVVFPVKGLQVVKAAADMGAFGALDSQGGLWVWGIAHDTDITTTPRQIAEGVVDFDVGARFVIAIDGATKVASIYGRIGSQWPNSSFSQGLPMDGVSAGLTQVAACCETVLGLSTDGLVYSMGTSLNNGLGVDNLGLTWALLEGVPPTVQITLGSRHGALITADKKLYCWGDGLSGALGDGKRHSVKGPTLIQEDRWNAECYPVQVGCTRGQPDCKRCRTAKGIAGGQEGQRTHVVTSDGGLWVAGTTHKGMGGDHLNKTMQPDEDLLNFYRVGGKAADRRKANPVPTGAAEDAKDPSMAAVVAKRMGMKDVKDFGANGMTNYLTNTKIAFSQPVHIHSIALSQDGTPFTWGCGSDGRTGLAAFMRGPGGSKRTMKCYVSTPSTVESLEDKKVVSMAAGRWWTFFVVQ